ncbi:single-pass membrane and coiled-coil domain-containing protein 2 [Peromyscus californicus insignis]|uniref:single-pass membrane and coiled-coil domain-containing protein 2 n=1 Tax=Peromyscus californicus insignis TaxID=564181 RepID=UPI0022A7850C|nr:single-pass membrane and coiled-coil domain-containing protein 2 [Peromyscus californicus insignis]
MAVTPAALSNEMSLQMRTVAKEQLTEKNSDFLQNVSVTEGVKEIVKMEHTSDRPEEKDKFSRNLQTDFLHKMDTKIWDTLEQESKHSQDPPSNPDEQEVTLVCEDPQVSLSQFSEKSTPAPTPESSILKLSSWNAKMGLQMKELGADHVDWLEKINGIIQKINNTESTVKSLLTEVISLENQSEHLEDPDQETNIEEKIIGIRKQLKEMNIKLAQVDACNEVRELKEKLIERIESFYKEMNVLNTKLEMYHTQGRETDSHSSEDSDAEQTEPLLPEASPTPSGSHTPPYLLPVWKHALKLFLMVYVITITGLSCYTLFVDATFFFERVLPSVLGRRTMWELREMMAPFLNLEAEDLLPS